MSEYKIHMEVPRFTIQGRESAQFSFGRSGSHAISEWVRKCSNVQRFVSGDNRGNREDVFCTDKHFQLQVYGDFEYADAQYLHSIFEDNTLKQIRMFCTYFEGMVVLQLRSPYNWIASRLEWLSKHLNSPWLNVSDQLLEEWCIMGEAILDSQLPSNVLFLNFDRWVVEEEYRKELGIKLGFDPELSKQALQTVSHKAGGSSFEGTKMQNTSNVLSRYEKYRDSVLYKRLFNARIQDIAKALFDVESPWDD